MLRFHLFSQYLKEIKVKRKQRRPGKATDLQADGQVDPAAEGGAHSSRVESQVFEELREGLRQGYPGPLLSYDHAGPHSRQVHSSSLEGPSGTETEKFTWIRNVKSFVWPSSPYLQRVRLQAEAFGAELHHAVGAEGVADFVLTDGRQPKSRVHLQLGRRDQDGLVAWVHAAHRHAFTDWCFTFWGKTSICCIFKPDEMKSRKSGFKMCSRLLSELSFQSHPLKRGTSVHVPVIWCSNAHQVKTNRFPMMQESLGTLPRLSH